MGARGAWLTLMGLWGVGCGSPTVELVVSLRTDYVPEREFDEVRLVLPDDARDSSHAPARGSDPLRGVRVADVGGLDPKVPRRLRLELRRQGRVVGERTGRVDHRRSRAVTLWISRACRGVACPEGTTCDSGECVPDTCVAGDDCDGPRACTDASECPTPAACADSICVGGRCAAAPRPGSCGAVAWCSPDEGCVPDEPRFDTDAGVPEDTLQSLTAGHAHTCVSWIDDRVACWGANDLGQLGDGTRMPRRRPIVVPDLQAARVTAGALHTCVLADQGGVLCWGAGSDGQLGAARGTRDRPVESALSEGLLAAGPRHTCAHAEGALSCVGGNARGELGDGTTAMRLVPALALLTDVTVVRAAAVDEDEARTSCAIDADAALYCWGANGRGQLADGTLEDRATPQRVAAPATFLTVAVGAGHVCGRTGEELGILCWGANDRGQLGGPPAPVGVPRRVAGTEGLSRVAAGAAHTCGVRADGRVLCWGASESGQCGTFAPVVTSPRVVEGVVDARELACGAAHCCALTGPDVVCWGANDQGQLGSEDAPASALARPVAGL